MILREFDQSTALGLSALVTLENEQGEEKHLFIGLRVAGFILILNLIPLSLLPLKRRLAQR